jgi:DNA glycosylase AlkZ-like
VIAERLTAQLLAGQPARDPVAVAERLLAVQGQDGRGVRLAIRARSTGLTTADFDRALGPERTLLITWLNRGTLHLVRSEDYGWLHTLTAPRFDTALGRRLGQEGVSRSQAERAVRTIARALGEDGPRTRAQLRECVAGTGVRTDGQAMIHLLALASLRGIAVRGPMIGRQHAYVLVDDWLGPQPRVDRARALAELARRYLIGHAPADARDLAKWSGLPLRDARAGLQTIASELVQREDGLVSLRTVQVAVGSPPAPKLLGAFDPVLLGWVSRAPVLGEHERALVSGGVFRPFALAGMRAVALWRLVGAEVILAPFGRLSKATTAALRRDAKDVTRYLEL